MCVIHASATDNRPHASVAVVDLSFITDENGNLNYSSVPFYIMDGINDAGVCVQVNELPEREKGVHKHTADTSDDMSYEQVNRFILDYAGSVEEAVKLLREKDIYSEFGNGELHWMISGPASATDDTIKTVIFQNSADGLVFIEDFINGKPVFTNFSLIGFDGTAETIGYGEGYERWQILNENYSQADSVMGTFDLMEKVFYSKTYDLYGDRFWYSEYAMWDLSGYYDEDTLAALLGRDNYDSLMKRNGGIYYTPALWDGLTKINGDINKTGIISPVVEEIENIYYNQVADGILWITVDTAVYDLQNLTLDLAVRESQDHYHFEIGEAESNGTNDIGNFQPKTWNPNEGKDGITEFTMFSGITGKEIKEGNDIQELIAEKTGVKVKEKWLSDGSAMDAIESMIKSGELPDFIDGVDGMWSLYDAKCLVPWDDYLLKYPNLKELYSDEEWEKFRQPDGHIYWANVFNNTYGKDRETIHNDSAFWIQVRVLEWAGYPTISTLDEYFDLLESYYAEHKSFVDGAGEEVEIIPYTILAEDWRYFCLESAPQFLDGYVNDGSVIVNTTDFDKPTIVDYNTTPTAKRYLEKLNEAYNKGLIYADFVNLSYDDYIAMLSTGGVLGMFDQYWDFDYYTSSAFKTRGLDMLGCDYVPLGLTIDEGMKQHYHIYSGNINAASGIAVTTGCEDPDRAFGFLNDILDQEIHDLRFWGIEGVDYLVDEDGLYYRTAEMRMNCNDDDYRATYMCPYSYMTQWLGTSRDGKNAMQPYQQSSEFFASCSEPLVKCFKAYGAGNYPDMIGSVDEPLPVWFPMYSTNSTWLFNTAGGLAWTKMGETKHEWLPKVVMAEDFEAAWKDYMTAYAACHPEDFLNEDQIELDRRIEQHQK